MCTATINKKLKKHTNKSRASPQRVGDAFYLSVYDLYELNEKLYSSFGKVDQGQAKLLINAGIHELSISIISVMSYVGLCL